MNAYTDYICSLNETSMRVKFNKNKIKDSINAAVNDYIQKRYLNLDTLNQIRIVIIIFQIELAPNGTPFGAKLIGKV